MSGTVDVKLINPFLQASLDVIKTACSMDVTAGKPEISKTEFNESSVIIMLGITGQVKGQVLIDMNEESAKKLASSMMMGMPVDSLDDMALSALSELGNMIMGNAATLFSTSGISMDITPPSTLRGHLVIGRYYTVNIGIPIVYNNDTLLKLNVAVKLDK